MFTSDIIVKVVKFINYACVANINNKKNDFYTVFFVLVKDL